MQIYQIPEIKKKITLIPKAFLKSLKYVVQDILVKFLIIN